MCFGLVSHLRQRCGMGDQVCGLLQLPAPQLAGHHPYDCSSRASTASVLARLSETEAVDTMSVKSFRGIGGIELTGI